MASGWHGGSWWAWLVHLMNGVALSGDGQLKEVIIGLHESSSLRNKIECDVSCSAESVVVNLDVRLDGEADLLGLSLSEDTEALSGVHVLGVDRDVSGGEGTETTDELSTVQGDVDIYCWGTWLTWAGWEGVDHLNNLLAEEISAITKGVDLSASLDLVNPSLVVETLNEVLNVGNLLVVLGSSGLPSLEFSVVFFSDSKNSLNFTLDD